MVQQSGRQLESGSWTDVYRTMADEVAATKMVALTTTRHFFRWRSSRLNNHSYTETECLSGGQKTLSAAAERPLKFSAWLLRRSVRAGKQGPPCPSKDVAEDTFLCVVAIPGLWCHRGSQWCLSTTLREAFVQVILHSPLPFRFLFVKRTSTTIATTIEKH